MHDITVRQMDFRFPDGMDPVVIPGEPERSYVIVGLSLLLPYLEPYLIRTMKAAKPCVTDPELREDLERFSRQEGQHYQQHIRFNEAIRQFGFPDLDTFEKQLDADYRRFTATKPLRWNLAYAEGFEALTTAMARFSFETGDMAGMHPAALQLWAWHLIEELEHRTVAFDVYHHVHGRYLYRLVWGTWAQWHMGRWIARVAKYMASRDPRMETEFGGPEAARERMRAQTRNLRKGLLPSVLRTFRPGYTPHDIEMTDDMKTMAAGFSKMAVRTS
jgi:predicted metal-dependent hydrolase